MVVRPIFLANLITFLCLFCGEAHSASIDYAEIERQLQGGGLEGRIHGSVEGQDILVFTWRHPDNFFINVQLPIFSKDPTLQEQLKQLKRHDRIRVKGSFNWRKAPIRHIVAREIVLVDPWLSAETGTTKPYQPGIIEEVLSSTQLLVKVHSVANEGFVLVAEYKDRVFPVINTTPELLDGLYRNDFINISYKVRSFPNQPIHLELEAPEKKPVQVVERIVNGHGQTFDFSGPLVMFPKSPQIKFNIFAIQQESSTGLVRNFTLTTDFNKDPSFDLFQKIRKDLQTIWDNHSSQAYFYRNRLVNENIWIRVRGVKNVVSPVQANPQIYINSRDDLVVEVR